MKKSSFINNSPKNILYDIAISLFYFGLLRVSEVREVKYDDVALLKEGGNPRIEVAFTHNRKMRNNGFKFHVSYQYYPMYDRYIKELYQKTIKAVKVQFLKNRNGKGKHSVQNT